MAKKKKTDKISQPVVTSAGMRRENVRRDNNVGSPSRDSVVEEIKWREEHKQ